MLNNHLSYFFIYKNKQYIPYIQKLEKEKQTSYLDIYVQTHLNIS